MSAPVAKKERRKRLKLIQGETLLSLESCSLKCDLGATKLRELIEAGKFPQPAPGLKALGLVRFRGRDVDDWIVEMAKSLDASVQLRMAGRGV